MAALHESLQSSSIVPKGAAPSKQAYAKLKQSDDPHEVDLPLYTSPGAGLFTPGCRPLVLRAFAILVLALVLFCAYHYNRLISFLSNTAAPQGVTKGDEYLLGLGIGDITGPVVEINLMGYADSNQLGTGLHMRQRARAFLVAEADGSRRWLLINTDMCMGETAVRLGVLERLRDLYDGLYDGHNVAIVGTHSHAGVGGFLQNVLPQITSRGFVKESYEATVRGIVLAAQRAHESLAPGKLDFGVKTLLDTNINRSPFAYMANPAQERARYEFDQNKDFTLLRFGGQEAARGFASFFSVHGTSLYRNNTLVSGDNKGMAAYLYEAYAEPQTAPGNTSFTAGFFQATVGDTSPNTLGAYCETGPDQGKPCVYENSTCNGLALGCQGRGPGFRVSDFESSKIIGENQFKAARELMEKDPLSRISGNVRAVHLHVNMSNYTFPLPNGTIVATCPPALGYSFAGGTSDGAGRLDFTQGRNGTQKNLFWERVKGAIGGRPTDEQARCHGQKPILFNSGFAHDPYDWSPDIVDMQIFRAGQLVILIVPSEFTTMAGRRLIETVRQSLVAEKVLGSEAKVVITGPANAYSHYVTTTEEYDVQRYEGASTLYGPHTLAAYQRIFADLVQYVSDDAVTGPDPGPPLPDLRGHQISMHLPVLADHAPLGSPFGRVLTDAKDSVYHVGESVSVAFQAANPRNNLKLEETYLEVEKTKGDTLEGWETVRTDSHPSTTFQWRRTSTVLGTSIVNITWTIEPSTPPGVYRIRYFGDAKRLIGPMHSFIGTSSNFTVSSP